MTAELESGLKNLLSLLTWTCAKVLQVFVLGIVLVSDIGLTRYGLDLNQEIVKVMLALSFAIGATYE